MTTNPITIGVAPKTIELPPGMTVKQASDAITFCQRMGLLATPAWPNTYLLIPYGSAWSTRPTTVYSDQPGKTQQPVTPTWDLEISGHHWDLYFGLVLVANGHHRNRLGRMRAIRRAQRRYTRTAVTGG